MTTSVCQEMFLLRMRFRFMKKMKLPEEPILLKVCEGAPDVDKCILKFDKWRCGKKELVSHL